MTGKQSATPAFIYTVRPGFPMSCCVAGHAKPPLTTLRSFDRESYI